MHCNSKTNRVTSTQMNLKIWTGGWKTLWLAFYHIWGWDRDTFELSLLEIKIHYQMKSQFKVSRYYSIPSIWFAIRLICCINLKTNVAHFSHYPNVHRKRRMSKWKKSHQTWQNKHTCEIWYSGPLDNENVMKPFDFCVSSINPPSEEISSRID